MGRLAIGAGIGGLTLTLLLVAALGPPAPAVSAPAEPGASAAPDPARMIERCRTVTVADAACEAAWAQRRRRFFGEGKDER